MLLVGNGTVVTRDENNSLIEEGAVCIDNGLIKEVGSFEVLKRRYPEAEFLDAHKGYIMPGLINSHHHLYSAFARGMSIPGNNPQNFLEILEGTWWKLDRKLSEKQTVLSAETVFLDCVRNGVTTVIDHHASYGYIEKSLQCIAEAARKHGVRACLAYEVSDRDGFDKAMEAVKENEEFISFAGRDNSGMLAAMMGLHASFTLSDSTLQQCRDAVPEGTGFHIHVAEGLSDAMHCREEYHTSIVERLHRTGILGSQTIAAHCIHIEDQDLELLKDTDTVVVHNPESNMGNAVGAADILTMYQKGILLGLGTDGYTSDMLESLKVANILCKHEKHNPSVGYAETQEMLFLNNSRIASRLFQRTVGSITRGACADLIVMEYGAPTPLHRNNINGHMLFGMNGRNTISTIINGKVLMKDRTIMNIDEERLLYESRIEAKKLWEELS